MNDIVSNINTSNNSLNSSFEMLSNIMQSLLNSDISIICEKVQILSRQSYTTINPEILDLYLINPIYIQDFSVQLRFLSSISQIISPSSPTIFSLPSFFRPLFKNHSLINPLLRCISNISSKFLFESLEDLIYQFSIEGEELTRKICLNIYYKLYLLNNSYLNKLILLLKRGLFDNNLKNNSIIIISELNNNYNNFFESILPFLLNEINNFDFIILIKLIKIFKNYLNFQNKYLNLIK